MKEDCINAWRNFTPNWEIIISGISKITSADVLPNKICHSGFDETSLTRLAHFIDTTFPFRYQINDGPVNPLELRSTDVNCYLYSKAAAAEYMKLGREITKCLNHAIDIENPNAGQKFPSLNRPSKISMYVGKEFIHYFESPDKYLPAFITNELTPFPLHEVIEISEILMASFHTVFPRTDWIPKNKLRRYLGSLAIPYSNELHTPITFYSLADKVRSLIKDTDLDRTIEVILVQKLKGIYVKETIRLAEYLKNPNKYIAVFNIPKIVSVEYPGTNVALRARIAVPLPTLVIPESMIKTGSENILSTSERFFEALMQKNFIELLAGERFTELANACPDVTKWWTGLLKVIATKPLDTIKEELSEYNSVKKIDKDPSELAIGNNLVKRVAVLPEIREKNSINGSLKLLDQEKCSLVRSKEIVCNEQYNCDRDISDQERYLRELQDRKAYLDNRKTTIVSNLTEIEGKLNTSLAQFKEAIVKLDKAITDIDTNQLNSTPPKLLIEKIQYEDSDGETHILYCSDIEELTKLLIGNNKLISISAYTEKPCIINVDFPDLGHSCPKVVGGPYRVSVSANGMKPHGVCFLRDASAVFGLMPVDGRTYKLKQHPHSAPVLVKSNSSISDFLNQPTNMCFGEAEAPLIKAFREKDLESIRRILYAWITSAWTKDQWGRDYNWFPSLDKFNVGDLD